MQTKNLLMEIGTEELPPKALRRLATALQDEFSKLLSSNDLTFKTIKYFATPRRLALYVTELAVAQEDKEMEIKGPALKAAYDASGNPTPAALGWAKSNNISLEQANTLSTDKGEWLYVKTKRKGKNAVDLIPDMFAKALAALPIPKLMHWGANRFEFVRPVHTLCIIFGGDVVQATILGLNSSRQICGHRFLCSEPLTLPDADSYERILSEQGSVIADYDKRKEMIASQVSDLAKSLNARADIDDSLLEEVTSLVELPKSYIASFDEEFLQVPSEALVYTMKGDQKYFPLYDGQGHLLPKFIFISNIHPDDPTSLIAGNEKVIRPRLSDAQFFFKTDRKHSLESFYPRLEHIVYQKDIGTVAFRSEIVGKVAEHIAGLIKADPLKTARAAHLAKCDLATNLVTEFTDIQGIAGMHYARLDNEDGEVSQAIFDQYLPRFAGDKIPTAPVSIAVSLAEKLVTIVGICGINLLPKGDKDPYGLRRAAIGVIRILLENNININLVSLIEFTGSILSTKIQSNDNTKIVSSFIFNRLKAYYKDRDIGAEIFNAVYDVHPNDILDFDKRVNAVVNFKNLPESEYLASAYKRVTNILAQNSVQNSQIDTNLLLDEEEKNLVSAINSLQPKVLDLYDKGNYKDALLALSTLKQPVDLFFDRVLVNDQDPKIRNNRIAIISLLHDLFARTANISVLY